MEQLTTKARPFVGYHADGDEPANANTVVRSRSFEESLERGEAEGLPDEFRKGGVCAIG